MEFPKHLQHYFSSEDLKALHRVLALDPRPRYQDNPDKVYGMPYEGYDIRFLVVGSTLIVTDVIRMKK